MKEQLICKDKMIRSLIEEPCSRDAHFKVINSFTNRHKLKRAMKIQLAHETPFTNQ